MSRPSLAAKGAAGYEAHGQPGRPPGVIPAEGPADCLELVRARLPGLSGTARQLGTHLINHAWESRGLTVGELAQAAGVSANAVIRFSQTLGYSGYRQLANELALSLGQAGLRSFTVPSEALPSRNGGDSAPAVVRRMVELQAQCLIDTTRHLSDTLLERAVDALASAPRVALGAMGGTAQIAQLASYRLVMLGVQTLWAPDPYVTLANAGMLEPGDAAVGISHSGQSRLTIEFLDYARARGATTLAVTAVPGSPVTRAADVVLAVFGPDVELSPGLQRFASRVSAMALIEALVAAVELRRFGTDTAHVERTRAVMQQTLEPPIVVPRTRKPPRG
jgi:RpiR family transcriptional regulator, carbohydrate utilization regulator